MSTLFVKIKLPTKYFLAKPKTVKTTVKIVKLCLVEKEIALKQHSTKHSFISILLQLIVTTVLEVPLPSTGKPRQVNPVQQASGSSTDVDVDVTGSVLSTPIS